MGEKTTPAPNTEKQVPAATSITANGANKQGGGAVAQAGKENLPWFKSKSKWENFMKDSMKTCQLIVVNFTTKWCSPCKKTKEGIEKLSKENKDVKFANIDIDHLVDVATAWKVEKMPTVLLLKRKEGGNKREGNVEKGDGANRTEKGSSGDEGSERGKEGSGKEGSQKGKESGNEDAKIKAETENFNIVGRLVGCKKIVENLEDEIRKHRYSIKDN